MTPYNKQDLYLWTVKELKEYCKEEGIHLESKTTKDDIIEKLKSTKKFKLSLMNPYITKALDCNNPSKLIPDSKFHDQLTKRFKTTNIENIKKNHYMELYDFFESRILYEKRKSFVVYDNRIYTLQRKDLWGGVVEFILEMRNASISDIQDIKYLDELKTLKHLDLSNNNITEITGLDRFKHLESLILSNNKITEIKGLDKLKNLIILDLSSNQINEINGLKNLSNIQNLDLSDNLVNSTESLKELAHLDKLWYLYLFKNPIASEIRKTFKKTRFEGNAKKIVEYYMKLPTPIKVPPVQPKKPAQERVEEIIPPISISTPSDPINNVEDKKPSMPEIKPTKAQLYPKYLLKASLLFQEQVETEDFKHTRTIGMRGECYVCYNILLSNFSKKYPQGTVDYFKNGFLISTDGKERVRITWNNELEESREHHDILQVENGKNTYIEVKSSINDQVEFTISTEELDFAKEHQENYKLYMVTNVTSEDLIAYHEFDNFFKNYEEG